MFLPSDSVKQASRWTAENFRPPHTVFGPFGGTDSLNNYSAQPQIVSSGLASWYYSSIASTPLAFVSCVPSQQWIIKEHLSYHRFHVAASDYTFHLTIWPLDLSLVYQPRRGMTSLSWGLPAVSLVVLQMRRDCGIF
jgi:hypothetical protein